MVSRSGFVEFIRNITVKSGDRVITIDTIDIPDDDSVIDSCYAIASEICYDFASLGFDTLYEMAFYNLAFESLVGLSNSEPIEAIRCIYQYNSLATGLVASASDVSTSTSLTIPAHLSEMSLLELGYLKTPWGRQYLKIAQQFRTLSAWGVS